MKAMFDDKTKAECLGSLGSVARAWVALEEPLRAWASRPWVWPKLQGEVCGAALVA